MKKVGVFGVLSSLFLMGAVNSAQAMELNWAGQFWSEFHFVDHYAMTSADNGGGYDAARAAGGGYYIPGGTSSASFETLFLRLRPSLVVNDNVYIKSEWWAGNPSYSLFGDAYPGVDNNKDKSRWYSNQSNGSAITAQRFWAELLTDFGTVQVGRIPLEWGLGLVWNAGNNLFDRYQSTGDSFRLVSKFGAFTFSPAYVRYFRGGTLSGACAYNPTTGNCATPAGGVADYSLMLKYENLEEDFEGGVNFVRRLAPAEQPGNGMIGPEGNVTGANFNTWDLYARKKFGKFTLAGEVPVTAGTINGLNYSTAAIAGELDWKMSDTWSLGFKAGHAPGQENSPTQALKEYKVFYFNPNYRIGTILFNYQLANFSGTNQNAPFDNPIGNANYIAGAGAFKTDKWTLGTGLIYAAAEKSAGTGQYFYNTVNRSVSSTPAVKDQGKSLGVEWDANAAFQWDDNMVFRLDLGLLFPGSYWKFSNTGTDNDTSAVFAAVARIGINF